MNFFEAQDRARKKTSALVFLFLLAVLALITLTNLLVMLVFGYLESSQNMARGQWQDMLQIPDWNVFFMIGLGVSTIVALGSLYKIAALSKGGASVAEMMNGALIVDGSGDLNRQKVLNVVEEMAIASGIPVPAVYLLDEDGINAFAAGHKPGDAVIGITRGAIEKLSREQLQGVIAHEFSHIFNGDMRLNLRLIGVLHGILVIGLIGYYIMRTTRYTGSRNSKNNGAGGILLLGGGLFAIGYAGTFFGNIIKAAVSRQREYLADSTAVQYTRNPDGIAGALKRIGGDAHGSILENRDTSQISHLLFGQGTRVFFNSLFATHPPLEKRIRAIQPNWDGKFDPGSITATDAESARPETGNREKLAGIMTTAAILEKVGQASVEHLQYAQGLIARIPEQISRTAHEPHGARALVYCLVASDTVELQQQQLDVLKIHADDGVYEESRRLINTVKSLDAESRLPIIDMCLPALRQLSHAQYALFNRNLDALIKIDARISLFEWSLQKILKHHLASTFGESRTQKQNRTLSQTQDACAVLLSVLIHSGEQHGTSPRAVFAKACTALGFEDIELIDKNRLELEALDAAIDTLAQLKPLQKPALLKACALAINADGMVTITEAELFRAVADSLDCPMPPLVAP